MKAIIENTKDEWFDLVSEAAEEIMRMPEEEFLAQLDANGVNVEEDLAEASRKTQQILDRFKKNRLGKLQQEYEAQVTLYRQGRYALPETPEARRQSLQAMLGSQFYGGRLPSLTAQFRNISELSDIDVETMLRSLKYLESQSLEIEH